MTDWTIPDFDICVCGDYRHQHVNGSGACRLNDLGHGMGHMGKCRKFRLHLEATEIPETYTRDVMSRV